MELSFSGKLLMIGYGGVARCVLPLLLDQLKLNPTSVTILDEQDKREQLSNELNKGIKFIQEKITEQNLSQTLGKLLTRGDLLVDLAYGIDTCALLKWCYDHGVMYINTSVEVWEKTILANKHPTEQTLYWRHMQLRHEISKWNDKHGATAVLDHGANPGLVSHFAKQALMDISEKILQAETESKRVKAIEQSIADKQFARLAQLSGIKVIHISERDTQIINKPKKVNEFVNTWSVSGFYEEGVAPAELGWGTHEKYIPANAYLHDKGPQNQICLGRMGIDTWVRSWVPQGEIVGMVIRHGEAFTLSDYLTIWEGGKVVYRPTVHYAYCPADYAMSSLHELKMNHYVLQEEQRVVSEEIVDGKDELGVLLMGHDFQSWWIGSILDIHTARKLVPGQNATTLQVAASVLSAICWMIKNPKRGVNVPDNLPFDEILKTARPFLGDVISRRVDWTPLKHEVYPHLEYAQLPKDHSDAWQFINFLL